MKHLKKICVMLVYLSMLLSYSGMTLAHSGRTDASGGHHDNKNVSGLGSYHYHCGGYPAHLHKNGVCPYTDGGSSSSNSRATTKKTSKYYQTSTVKKVQNKLNKLGYKCGKADGIYGAKTKSAIEEFQKDEDMTVNDKIKKALLKKLEIYI